MSAIKAGGEVDSWCTKCKLVLNHRVIAMVGGAPVRVECSTCNSHHNFRARAPGDKGPAKAPRERATSSRSSAVGSGIKRVTKAEAEAQAIHDERSRKLAWEKSIAGRSPSEFRGYRISEVFEQGDLINHKKFGEGVVVRVIDAGKVEILFRDEPRTLAHNVVL